MSRQAANAVLDTEDTEVRSEDTEKSSASVNSIRTRCPLWRSECKILAEHAARGGDIQFIRVHLGNPWLVFMR